MSCGGPVGLCEVLGCHEGSCEVQEALGDMGVVLGQLQVMLGNLWSALPGAFTSWDLNQCLFLFP